MLLKQPAAGGESRWRDSFLFIFLKQCSNKKWVEKNLKNRHIKTDTGFEIKGKMDDFEDFMKYGIRHNGNGTIDIVIKNVHFYNEK